jgi:hypothetical protein
MAGGARAKSDLLVTLSVFDRLIDRDPRNRLAEEAMTRAQSVRELKNALRRDLEWLLNSRRVTVPRSTSSDCRISAVDRSATIATRSGCCTPFSTPSRPLSRDWPT